MKRAALWCAALALLGAAYTTPAGAADGSYVIDGGTAREQAQVHSALQASTFDWNVLPSVVVQIARGAPSCAIPGAVTLDANLLDSGRFSWGVVLHEFAHELDFLVLDDADRADLSAVLGGRSWWSRPGLDHDELGSERFASALAWAFWPTQDNVMQPILETGPLNAGGFRAALTRLLARHQIRRGLYR